MRGAQGQLHHYRKIEPARTPPFQSDNPTHNPIPPLEYPLRYIVVPTSIRILGRVEITEAVRFWLNNFNIIWRLYVKRVPLCGDAVPKQLTTLFVTTPVQLMNFQDRPRNQPGVVWIERLKPVNDFL